MKLVIVAMVIFSSAGNALAQPYPLSLPEPDPIDSMPIDECRTNLRQCLDDIGGAGADNTARLSTLAERMGFSSVDDMLASDCRSRRGTWNGSECLCAEPSEWYTAESQECCTPSVRRYEYRMRACQDSGGSWTCRGECRCPNQGQQLADGICVGDATSREEIERLRGRIPELERQITDAQSALDAAREQGEDQVDQIADLEDQLDAARNALDELRDLLAVRERQLRDALGQVPPAPNPLVTPPAPLPGTAEAIAAAAGGSEPNPLAPTPLPEEGEEEGHFCNRGFGEVLLCYILPAAALAGLGVGIACAAGACGTNEATISWGRRE